MKDAEESGGKLRELGIHRVLQTCRQECEGLEQPFDMGISALVGAQLETPRNLWVAPCEVGAPSPAR